MKRHSILFVCILVLCACKKDSDVYTVGNPKGPALSDIIRISSVSQVTVEADTIDVSLIGIHINAQSAQANRAITLSTTLGNFLNGNKTMSLTADANGNAQAVIRSSLPGDAQVTATVKSISIDTVVHFKPALPDDLLLTADNYNLDASASVNATATLSRNPGRGLPSDPVKVFFTVTPGSGATGLICPAFATSTNHVVTVAISNPYNVTGTFVVEAKTVSDNADTLRRKITLILK